MTNRTAEILAKITACYSDAGQEQDRVKARVMFLQYVQLYEAEIGVPVDIEIEFGGPLENPVTGDESEHFVFRGKADLVVRNKYGDLVNVEHKTAATPFRNYAEMLALDMQINSQVPYLSAHYGEPVRKVLYDVIGKTKHTIGQQDKQDEKLFEKRLADVYFERRSDLYLREPVTVQDSDILETFRTIWWVSERILECRESGFWPQATQACNGMFGRPCSYLPICAARGKDLEGNLRMMTGNTFDKKRPHSELKDLDTGSKSTLTYSSISKFLNCPRKFFYRIERKLVRAQTKSPALFMGTTMHSALAAHFGIGDVDTYFEEGD
jgi:hypothetical protein